MMAKQRCFWMLAAILICGMTTVVMVFKVFHKQKDTSVPAVQSEELIRTSQSWDGVDLPDYLQGRP